MSPFDGVAGGKKNESAGRCGGGGGGGGGRGGKEACNEVLFLVAFLCLGLGLSFSSLARSSLLRASEKMYQRQSGCQARGKGRGGAQPAPASSIGFGLMDIHSK